MLSVPRGQSYSSDENCDQRLLNILANHGLPCMLNVTFPAATIATAKWIPCYAQGKTLEPRRIPCTTPFSKLMKVSGTLPARNTLLQNTERDEMIQPFSVCA